MKHLLNAAYCVKFDDYLRLKNISESFPDYPCGVELVLYPDDREYMERLKEQEDLFRNMPVSLHGPFRNYNAASEPGSKEQRAMIEAYREAFDIYGQFHALSIVMHTNDGVSIKEEEKVRLQQNCILTILEIARLAEGKEIHLTVENVGLKNKGTLLFDQEEFIDLFDRLPKNITALIDIGHALVNAWDLRHVVSELNGRITAYHIHNNDGRNDSHRPLYEEGLRYSKEEMNGLLKWMELYSPDAEWILEYAYGNHITDELLHRDMRELLAVTRKINAAKEI